MNFGQPAIMFNHVVLLVQLNSATAAVQSDNFAGIVKYYDTVSLFDVLPAHRDEGGQ